MMKTAAVLLALAAPAAAQGWEPSLPAAIAAAKKSGQKILVDFTAPWCYSCYYMEKNVLDRPAFWDIARSLQLAKVDVDRPEGKAIQSERRVRFLPSFLVLDSQGKELGRILGEQREADFLAQLKALVGEGKPSAEDAAVKAVEAMIQKDELDKAAAALAKGKGGLAQRSDWKILTLRVALKKKPTAGALAEMAAANDGCELAYDLSAAFKGEPAADALKALRPRLDAWYERRYWVPRRDRCADFRSGVQAMAEFYERSGDAAAKAATLERAAALIGSESDRIGLGTDRNYDDDRRYFLEAAGKDGELEALFPRLVDAYPSDYVYTYRYAKWLASKGRHADALPWIEKAARLCYGANRLTVTKVQAEIYDKLGRRPDAVAILRREIKGYAVQLPKETQPLRDLLATFAITK
ncbi:MAG: thioredoxin family protein [Elusimicrobia bacterium]|nr:thioredoxin family protein [Elusimicrobiota bacterium]